MERLTRACSTPEPQPDSDPTLSDVVARSTFQLVGCCEAHSPTRLQPYGAEQSLQELHRVREEYEAAQR